MALNLKGGYCFLGFDLYLEIYGTTCIQCSCKMYVEQCFFR